MGSFTPSPPALQTPFTSPALSLTHRVVLAPMTRMRASNTTGLINPTAATYYAERTTQPGALLISEGTTIHPRGKGFPRTPGLWTDAHAQAWEPITDAVHARGGTFFAQLWHVGRVAVPSLSDGQPPLSSTTAHLPGYHVSFGAGPEEAEREAYVPSHAMTVSEIKEVVAQFAAAARRAIEIAGFDGVEIHAANGYLLDCFVHDNINTRGDEYGGPAVENRLRFPLEVVDAVVRAVGARRTAVRLAPFHVLQGTGDSDRVATFGAFAAALEAKGLAYVHLVEPRYDLGSKEGAFSGCIAREKVDGEGMGDRTIWPFRRILKTTPVIGAGGYDAVSAAQAIEEGRIDLAAFGRYFTSNPDLPERLFKGLPLTKYHRPTFYTSGEEGYLGWPQWSEK
ncbi:putative NADPH dehydrogenase [Aspergillus japonicus CBS 114.51]|uniref:Putative NADPH dehydrogenase n=1 Tax=Aspergillus japonicus CBS 114.51 TaxID=1448312 RepID=A0A8T8WLC2_ASPJA|nr:putative NADPH dehydrogenase [Aspergillus japonicus CBS 114.51]RAH76576.1 putative NADPH dehydrogenase [Aspergillus japonicus CBS 114.51]